MLELDNLKVELEGYRTPLGDLYRSLDLENKENRIDELNHLMEEPDFWNDTEKSTRQSKELGSLKEDVATYKKLSTQFEDLFPLIDIRVISVFPSLFFNFLPSCTKYHTGCRPHGSKDG